MKPIISINNLTKKFNDLIAVNNITLKIFEGEFVALLGPNGAGKTTLIEMLEGVQLPDSGNIQILDKHWGEDDKGLKKQIGLSFQETKFFDKITTLETLKLFGGFYNLSNERIQEVLNLIQLRDKKNDYVSNLSGGQRQRLSLGIAVMHFPKILFLDEPTTGLDPKARKEIWDILMNLKKTGTTLLLTTHYMEEAEVLCDRIIIMNSGNILAEGTMKDLLKKLNSKNTVRFKFKKFSNKKLFNPNIFKDSINWDEKNFKGIAKVKDAEKFMELLLKITKKNKLALEELTIQEPNLNDLFLSMAGRTLNDD